MEIIKKGKTTSKDYKLVCRNCGCTVWFDRSDIKIDLDGEYIVCPSCGDLTAVDLAYIRDFLP